MNRIGFVLLFFFQWLLAVNAAAKEPVRLVTHIEPPYSYIQHDQFVGININLMEELTKRLGRELSITLCPIARCLVMLEKGQADFLIGLRKTPQRVKHLHFLELPYNVQHFPLKFFMPADSKLQLKEYKDLNGLKIGVLRGASYFPRFDNDESLVKVSASTHEQLVNLLLKNRIDTFLERTESIRPWLSHETYQKQIRYADYEYRDSVKSYIAMSKKSPLITELKQINAIQKAMLDEGFVRQLFDKESK